MFIRMQLNPAVQKAMEIKMNAFKVGDQVVVVSLPYYEKSLKVGQLCKVKSAGYGKITVEGSNYWSQEKNFRLATAADLGSNAVPLKVGDKLVCLDTDSHTRDDGAKLVKGKVYTVLSLNNFGDPTIDDGITILNKGRAWGKNRFRLATEAELAKLPKSRAKGGKGQQVLNNAKALTLRNLRFSEDLFLRAYGWSKVRGGLFKAPKGYETNSVNAKGQYDRRHAVNSQVASLSRTKA